MASPQRKTKPSERLALPVQQARSRATRERLLAAGEKVFAQKGFNGARLADIAEEAGCSVGAVYFRFKDKDALFQAIAEDYLHEARERLPMMLGVSEPAAIVRACVLGTAANFRQHRGLFRAIMERGFEIPNLTVTFFALRGAGMKHRNLPFAVRVLTQMVYGFLLTGILNPRAPTKIDDDKAVEELVVACTAYLGV
jgi:AcrR family transcriptional regulator